MRYRHHVLGTPVDPLALVMAVIAAFALVEVIGPLSGGLALPGDADRMFTDVLALGRAWARPWWLLGWP